LGQVQLGFYCWEKTSIVGLNLRTGKRSAGSVFECFASFLEEINAVHVPLNRLVFVDPYY
jgi:hypothetical protein